MLNQLIFIFSVLCLERLVTFTHSTTQPRTVWRTWAPISECLNSRQNLNFRHCASLLFRIAPVWGMEVERGHSYLVCPLSKLYGQVLKTGKHAGTSPLFRSFTNSYRKEHNKRWGETLQNNPRKYASMTMWVQNVIYTEETNRKGIHSTRTSQQIWSTCLQLVMLRLIPALQGMRRNRKAANLEDVCRCVYDFISSTSSMTSEALFDHMLFQTVCCKT